MVVDVRKIARAYLCSANMEIGPSELGFEASEIPEGLVRKIANRFHEQAHRPNDPEVRAQYLRMADEARAQLSCMTGMGVRVRMYPHPGQPYGTARELCEALDSGADLYVYPTEHGHGPEGYEDPDNPLLLRSSIGIDGVPALHNDVLRAAHDYFGHYLVRAPFNLRGELSVAYAHLRMFSPEVHGAVLNEFVGQISWFYFGPHILREDGSAPRRGDEDWIHPAERPFADQKVNLMPSEWVAEFLEWGRAQSAARHTVKRCEELV
ncbi:hypothetical protein J7F03_27510 [Streptomyces sp. ISL-43]|uniref:hypothetical protein n=1 Tax=Streptomyces sp. ISL-43 TaxID=2819183 RepID=UPI001BE51F7F|nr:hypothetical protein [Streptomyces sp. ISL-43]MBT2450752.1 hypothetical protein [Streptomyces sp. ISL-43]